MVANQPRQFLPSPPGPNAPVAESFHTSKTAAVPGGSITPPSAEGGCFQNMSLSSHRWTSVACSNCGHVHRFVMPCSDFFCHRCRQNRAAKIFNKYIPYFRQAKDLKAICLTMRNRRYLTRAWVDEFRSYISKLIRLKFWKKAVRGGLYCFELTHNGYSWHLHVHMVLDADFIPKQVLQAVWKKFTKTSWNTRVHWIPNGEKALRYMLKYAVKIPKDVPHKAMVNSVFRGIRLVAAFGTLYGFKVEKEPFVCPSCGNTHWLPEVEIYRLLYNHRPKSQRPPPPWSWSSSWLDPYEDDPQSLFDTVPF